MSDPEGRGRPTILIIDSKPIFGGGQRMIAEVVRALDAYRVVVVRPVDAPEEDRVHGAAAVIRQAFPAWPLRMGQLSGMVAAMPGALRAADRLGQCLARERPALVIVNDLYAAIPLVLLRSAGITVPWCFWIHSCDLPQGPAVRWLLRRASALVAVSEAAAAPWRDGGFPRTMVIRNAVTLPVEEPRSAGPRDTWGVLVAGRLDPNKNVVGLVQAWAMVRSTLEQAGPARLLVAGDGPEASEVQRTIAEHGLQDVVRCLGWREDLLALMQEVDAVALVSHQEALGLTLIEAQSLGRAVMGTPAGGIPEVIQDGVTGILARSSAPVDLAAALVRLRHEGHLLAPAGRSSALRRFSPELFQKSVSSLVGSLLKTGQPPPPAMSDYADVAARAVQPGPSRRPPTLSVVTVVRNGRHLLERCCASIRAQTHQEIEHLVIDGASSDGTQAWLEQHGGGLGAWITEPDLGISDAFNKGITLAQGEFVALVNADDTWLPETAALAIRALRSDPGAAWCFGGCDFLLDGQVVLHRDGDARYARTIHRWMPALNHPTVVVRRSVYERHGLFRTDLRLAMDYDVLLRFHRAGERGICIPATLARMDLGGVSNGEGVFRAHREAAAVAIHHGRAPFLAHLDRLRLDVVPRLRQFAIRCGLQGPWRRWKSARRGGARSP